MTTEQRIRLAAKSKVRVTITSRRRSKSGFYVSWPGGSELVASRKHAISMLLAKARCAKEQLFSIKPGSI